MACDSLLKGRKSFDLVWFGEHFDMFFVVLLIIGSDNNSRCI